MKTRWVVLKTDWWECLWAAVPFLMADRGDRAAAIPIDEYRGPVNGVRDVILGPHRAVHLAPMFNQWEKQIVLFETENILDPSSMWVERSSRLRLNCPRNPWMNYSAANAAMFGDEVRPLRAIHKLPARDNRTPRPIDVLFVGSLNHRRAWALAQLRRAGVRVHVPEGPVFGSKLAILENQAKILLNVHYYTPGVFESFRVVPAAHRGTPVISETSERNEGADWAPCHPYADLVEATLAALKGQKRGTS